MSDKDILFGFDDYITSGIQNYWNNCLFVLPFGENQNANIIWGRDPNPSTTKFRIYRAIGDESTPFSNFVWIKELNNTYDNYIDQAVTSAPENVVYAYYYVKALNGSIDLGNTNSSRYPSNSMSPIEISIDWNNVLDLTTADNYSPRLVWAPHPSITVNNYIVYRAQSSVPLSNPALYASPIATLGANVFEFVDNDVRLSGSTYFYYFVKGKYGTQYTARTNIVNTQGGFFKENNSKETMPPVEFEVMNFPNPFNPVTTINYSLPEDGYTELKVYNIYGELVETLVSGNKEAGSYSARFPANGRELSSGIYLYTLTSGRYKTTGKMTLVK